MSETAGALHLEGALTQAGAARALETGVAAIASGVTDIDLAAVSEIDSAALAVIFAWMRAARDQGKEIQLQNLPQNLHSLAEVYGVSELLPRCS